jgi:uncharacterized protein YdaU (DUF1376 family)
MNPLPWYKRNPTKALQGMMGLSLEERAVYNTVLDLIYERGEAIPDDASWIASWCGCSVRILTKARAALIVKGKLFALNLNGVPCLMNRKAAEEIAEREELSRTRAESGREGGRKPKPRTRENNDLPEANASILVGQTGSNCSPDLRTEDISSGAKAPSDNARASNDDYPPNAFEIWYAAFPNKVGRAAALKAFNIVRRARKATFAELMSGLARYIRTKPPDRAWCNPATWLNQGRWADEPAPVTSLRPTHGTDRQNAKLAARHDNLTGSFAGSEDAAELWRRTQRG